MSSDLPSGVSISSENQSFFFYKTQFLGFDVFVTMPFEFFLNFFYKKTLSGPIKGLGSPKKAL